MSKDLLYINTGIFLLTIITGKIAWSYLLSIYPFHCQAEFHVKYHSIRNGFHL